jgi:putative alpha-1,2-mannosidase
MHLPCFPNSPFFDLITIQLPKVEAFLVIESSGAAGHIFVKSLQINGESVQGPVILHSHIASGGMIKFEMTSTPQAWESITSVCLFHFLITDKLVFSKICIPVGYYG